MAAKDTLTFTDEGFDQEVLASQEPVLVDFWATWCPPCIKIGPIVDQLATDYAGKVKVGKLDVDANEQVASRYGVRSIPTLLLFKGGQILEQRTGAMSKPEFEKMLDKHL